MWRHARRTHRYVFRINAKPIVRPLGRCAVRGNIAIRRPRFVAKDATKTAIVPKDIRATRPRMNADAAMSKPVPQATCAPRINAETRVDRRRNAPWDNIAMRPRARVCPDARPKTIATSAFLAKTRFACAELKKAAPETRFVSTTIVDKCAAPPNLHAATIRIASTTSRVCPTATRTPIARPATNAMSPRIRANAN